MPLYPRQFPSTLRFVRDRAYSPTCYCESLQRGDNIFTGGRWRYSGDGGGIRRHERAADRLIRFGSPSLLLHVPDEDIGVLASKVTTQSVAGECQDWLHSPNEMLE